jgi:hypothetical protein
MHREEQLLAEVRECEEGTYAKGRAWVTYMREAKFGSNPRRVFADMMRRHLKWPLSMRVAVKTPQGYLQGKIVKHLREDKNKCIVDFSPVLVNYDGYGLRFIAYVPFRSIKKIDPH